MLQFFTLLSTAQPVTQTSFSLPPPILWFLIGITLCATEFLLPKKIPQSLKFVALLMGINALIVWLLLWRASVILSFQWQYLMYDGFSLQLIYWMGLSLASVIWIRPIFLPRKKFVFQEANEAESLTEILPGKTGRVLYEGISWQAVSALQESAIAPHQKVYVLRREGNTLTVVTENFFQP